jgi:hypothetical protein
LKAGGRALEKVDAPVESLGKNMAPESEYLNFTFAPHVLEDLGVNLYTSVAKALVEFVANAHDADAEWVDTSFDEAKIKHARDTLKANFELEKAQAKKEGTLGGQPLAERTLPDDIQILIEDNGLGMSRSDLEHKFLVIGRRRRKGQEQSARTEKKRIVMGRKGLGKLAGFGIAHKIEITSKIKSEKHATRITLNLDDLLRGHSLTAASTNEQPPKQGGEQPASSNEQPPKQTGEQSAETPARQTNIQVPVEAIADGGGLTNGTRIVLKSLVYDAVRGDLERPLTDALGENFYGIEPEDFAIRINGKTVDTSKADFAFAYPESDLDTKALVSEELPIDLGPGKIPFQYRIRFRPPKNQLPAKARGVRVYAHKRLASAPDLLDAKSATHGFQYTSYLDGIVVADFIDEQPTDYISTDRQTLRWDTPVLTALRTFLTEQIEKAVTAYANAVEESLEHKLKGDPFTRNVVFEGKLPPHRERTAWRIAKILAGRDSGNLESGFYQTTIKSIVSGLGHGEILGTIQELSEQQNPDLGDVIREVTKLTRHEFDEFMTIVDSRIRAIDTLAKLVEDVDFKAAKNEEDLHELFEKSPWLIDPTFFEFLISDKTENELADRLAKELEIGKYTEKGYDPSTLKEVSALETNRRPDLVFLLCNTALNRIVIVELKAPNTPLHIDHLTQLKGYMNDAEEFLQQLMPQSSFRVEGLLIGSLHPSSKAEKIVQLRREMKKYMGPNCDWKAYDILEVLTRTRNAHREILDVYRKASMSPATKPAA